MAKGNASNKKSQLLSLAKSGSPRPSMKDELGRALNNYTSTASHSFDPGFTNEIRTLRADWFRSRKKNQELPIDLAQ